MRWVVRDVAGGLLVVASLATCVEGMLRLRDHDYLAALAVILLGLAACANPVMGAQGGVAVLPCVLLARREGRFGVREVAAAVMGGALPLVLYAWVPWIGAHAPDDVFVLSLIHI